LSEARNAASIESHHQRTDYYRGSRLLPNHWRNQSAPHLTLGIANIIGAVAVCSGWSRSLCQEGDPRPRGLVR